MKGGFFSLPFRAKPQFTGLLFHKRVFGNNSTLVVHKSKCYRTLLIVLMILIRGLPQITAEREQWYCINLALAESVSMRIVL